MEIKSITGTVLHSRIIPLWGSGWRRSMRHVYIVIGACGEYSDHQEWPVAAYLDENTAKDHVVKAAEAYNHVVATIGDYAKWPWDDERRNLNPFDPDMRGDYTGTNYYYWAVELREELYGDALNALAKWEDL